MHKEDARNIVVWRKSSYSYYLWFIHFTWIIWGLLFEVDILVSDTSTWSTYFTVVLPGLTSAFAAFLIVIAILQTLTSDRFVVVASDDGIRRVIPGSGKYKVTYGLPWGGIVGVTVIGGTGQIATIRMAGPGRTISLRVDSDNTKQLCGMLMKNVPREKFSGNAYSYCSIYAS